jgi:hypothetical protein
MRFMMIIFPKDYENAKPGTVPDLKHIEVMRKYNEQLQKAGVLLALDGLTPPSTMSARVNARRTTASSVLTSRCAQKQGKTHTQTPGSVCGRFPINDLHSPGVPRGDADCRHCQLTLACIVTGLTKPADRLSIRTDFGLMEI